MKTEALHLKQRYLAVLLGVAVGDALGATVEFVSPDEVHRRYGELTEIVGGGWLGLKAGDVTDDTQLTLAVAEGILEDPSDPVVPVGRRFISWLEGEPKDVGNACRIAISAASHGGDWSTAVRAVTEALGERSAGNGSLMRTLPVALAYYGNDARVVEVAKQISRMTHPPQLATSACQAYCLLVCRLLDGFSKEDAVHWVIQNGPALVKMPPEIRAALQVRTDEGSPKASGYVVDSLRAAAWAFLGSSTAAECVVRAVNLGDDADTVGAIAGGLSGAYYGALPSRWVRLIVLREHIEHVAFGLAAMHGY